MTSYNRVILAGNLTRDVSTRQLGNDRQVASFGLAVNRIYRDRDGQKQEEVTFVDCEAWGRTAELASQYLAKGRGVLVEGRLRLDTWENRDGDRRSKLLVVVDQLQFLGDGRSRSDAAAPPPAPAAAPAAAGHDDDEPPF